VTKPGTETRRRMRYVRGIPKRLTKGEVLVHNSVEPQALLGRNGFRAWTQRPDRTLVVCRCKWAGVDLHGLTHHRVNPKLVV
jgi:hypothetical protein